MCCSQSTHYFDSVPNNKSIKLAYYLFKTLIIGSFVKIKEMCKNNRNQNQTLYLENNSAKYNEQKIQTRKDNIISRASCYSKIFLHTCMLIHLVLCRHCLGTSGQSVIVIAYGITSFINLYLPKEQFVSFCINCY